MAPSESKPVQAVFIHEKLLTAILPLQEGEGEGGIENKIPPKKATLLVAEYHRTKV